MAAEERFRDGERLMAFLDDVYVVCAPDRVGRVFSIVEQELQNRAHIHLHHGKTQVWNRGGVQRSERDHQIGEGCEAWCGCVEGRPRVANHRTGSEGFGSAHWNTRIRAGVPGQEGPGAGNFVPKDSMAERSSGSMAHSPDVWFHACQFLVEGSRSRPHCRVCGPSRCQGVGVPVRDLGSPVRAR